MTRPQPAAAWFQRVHPIQWLASHDRGLLALRRAGRAAIVMPAVFAIGDKVIGNPTIALFGTFGSFAMLLLADFGGPLADRLRSLAALALIGLLCVCLGTAVSQTAWLSAVVMGLLAFCVLFVGVISSLFASASVSLLLAFILPASLPAPISAIPDRLAGWGMAAGWSLLAVAVLWPAPALDPLRGRAAAACRVLAARLRAQAGSGSAEREAQAAEEALSTLLQGYYRALYGPTGIGTGPRTIVRLVDELGWVHTVIGAPLSHPESTPADAAAARVRAAAADVMDAGGALLADVRGDPSPLRTSLEAMHVALAAAEVDTSVQLPLRWANAHSSREAGGEGVGTLVASLEPGFRAQELDFAVSAIAADIELSAAAERRSWLERALGRQPAGVSDTFSSARERIGTHLERHSVWLHNSIRGAVGLALAILIADLTGVQHSFWVVLGTLSVLRSNALTTGQSAVRSVLGTSAGVIVGALLLSAIGTNATLLWLLLPLSVLFAGFAPAAISFPAGQAAFTLVLVILYNILQPVGWHVGLLRVEDVAIGCGVSLGVGLLFWPRGGVGALRQAVAEAFVDASRSLAASVGFGMDRCDSSGSLRSPPAQEQSLAASSSRRLDDAFRSYLAERGAKQTPLGSTIGVLNGAAALRLAAAAVLDLWQRDEGCSDGDRATAREVLLASTTRVVEWYERFAASLIGLGEVPEPLAGDDDADARLLAAVRHDLTGDDGLATATAVRMLWTANHLDAIRRLQGPLVDAARTAIDPDHAPSRRESIATRRAAHLAHGR